LAVLGAPVLAGAVLVVLIVVVALCWTLTYAGRSGRFAMLIGAWRSGRADRAARAGNCAEKRAADACQAEQRR
jgi:hypothetical protein